MKAIKKIPALSYTVKCITAVLMCCCLVLLTGINFIVFPGQPANHQISSAQKSEKDPSAPVEEKSSSNSSLSVQEEYLHDQHSLDLLSENEKLLHHKNLVVEKLQVVHFELISPPPDAYPLSV
jgi:hypothetical protein